MATINTLSAAMKTEFIGPVRDMLSSNKVLLWGQRTRDASKQTKDPVSSRPFKGIQPMAEGISFNGNDYRIPLRTSRNQGIGPRAESATLPAAGAQGYQYISDTLSYWYGLFSVTGPLVKASRNDKGSFKRAIESEMTGVTDDLKRAMNIAAFGTKGSHGATPLATIASGATSATQTLDSSIWLQGGEYVDIYDPTGATRRNSAGSLTVDTINRGTSPTIVLSASVATTTNDIVVRASSDSVSATPNNDLGASINGLGNIVASSGALHGLNPSSVSVWASSVVDANGAVIGENYLRQLVDDIGFEAGSDEELLGIWTRGQRARYAASMTAQKRFNDAQSVTLHGGFKAVLFDEMPMVVDDHCPRGYTYMLNTDAMYWAQDSDWEWGDLDGNTLKWQSRTDSYIGYLYKYCNLGTTARNRHGVIQNGDDDNL